MSTHLLLAGARQSRFVSRWLAADPDREAALAHLSGLSLADVDLDQLLSKMLASGVPMGAALRRLRGLLFAAIVERDVAGRADLAEVLAAISRFADFAVQKALADQHAALCELHGVPIGEESGRPQQMIVVGMGKLGGRELNVSSDIDLIFLYPEGGETVCSRDDQRPLSNHEFFVRLGKRLIAQLAEITEDGYCFRVDMALRPNGASGPLAASFAMAGSSVSATPASSADSAVSRYSAPESRKAKPRVSATRLATVPLPDAVGPSMVITGMDIRAPVLAAFCRVQPRCTICENASK